MGYSTDFDGTIEIVPALNAAEIEYLNKFASTRRMKRGNGPYFVDGTGFMGQGTDADVQDHNVPPEGQPGLWCQWVPTHDGAGLEWDGGEKFYHGAEWMRYLIDHFLKPGALAKDALPFLTADHICNGTIYAQGEEAGDLWLIDVTDNVVTVKRGVVEYV